MSINTIMSQNETCIIITFTHSGSIRLVHVSLYKKIHKTLFLFARKTKTRYWKLNITKSFSIHKKKNVYSNNGPKRIPPFKNRRNNISYFKVPFLSTKIPGI